MVVTKRARWPVRIRAAVIGGTLAVLRELTSLEKDQRPPMPDTQLVK